jgi:FMN phosphatase YigB (HAD superfamily)
VERAVPQQPAASTLRAVVFDVGETVVDETTEYGTWADWLDVPRHTFSAMFGAVIALGEDYRQAFQHFRPGFDLAIERLQRERAAVPEHFDERDLYPDARPCLARLKELVSGRPRRQPDRSGRVASAPTRPPCRLHRHLERVGVEKPSLAFFDKIIAECGCPPGEIAYVGDRLDNDINPALAAGMVTVFLRRGPWGFIHADHPSAAKAHLKVASLAELPQLLQALTSPGT